MFHRHSHDRHGRHFVRSEHHEDAEHPRHGRHGRGSRSGLGRFFAHGDLRLVILHLIKDTVDAAHAHKIPVSVCGEMAGDPIMTPLLLGLGVDELSAAPALIPSLKFMVRRLKMPEAATLAEFALGCESGAEILARCQQLALQCAPVLFENNS